MGDHPVGRRSRHRSQAPRVRPPQATVVSGRRRCACRRSQDVRGRAAVTGRRQPPAWPSQGRRRIAVTVTGGGTVFAPGAPKSSSHAGGGRDSHARVPRRASGATVANGGVTVTSPCPASVLAATVNGRRARHGHGAPAAAGSRRSTVTGGGRLDRPVRAVRDRDDPRATAAARQPRRRAKTRSAAATADGRRRRDRRSAA